MLQGKTRPGEQDETNARGEKCRNDKNARNYSDEKKMKACKWCLMKLWEEIHNF